MPSKFVIRSLQENAAYHVFNRGVEKKDVFVDDQDRRVFLFYLNIYTGNLDQVTARYSDLPARLKDKNLGDSLDLLAYCLMPNHFHLVIFQKEADAMPRLLKQVTNGYTAYFNQKHNRVGSLFAGRYRAVTIGDDDLLAHVVRYVHLNPVVAGLSGKPGEWGWCSYKNYMGENGGINCETHRVGDRFASSEDFAKYHADQAEYARELERIKHLIIDLS